MSKAITANRNIGIDLAKVIACMAVVGLHCIGQDASPVNACIYFLCGCAVPIFFMANGYFTLNRKSLDYSYVFKKICSIAVVFLLWSVPFGLFVVLRGKSDNFVITEILKPLLQKGFLPQLWFLGALILVLLVAPLIYRYFPKGKLCHLLLHIGTIAVLVNVCSLVNVAQGGGFLQSNVIQTFRLWTWLFYFVLGGCLGRQEIKDLIVQKLSSRVLLVWISVSALVVLLWQCFFWHLGYRASYAEYFYDDPSTMLYSTGVFIGCDAFGRNVASVGSMDFFRLKGLVNLLTPLTMGIYILHPILITRVVGRFYNLSNPFLNFVLMPCLFIVCAVLVFVCKRIPVINRWFRI